MRKNRTVPIKLCLLILTLLFIATGCSITMKSAVQKQISNQMIKEVVLNKTNESISSVPIKEGEAMMVVVEVGDYFYTCLGWMVRPGCRTEESARKKIATEIVRALSKADIKAEVFSYPDPALLRRYSNIVHVFYKESNTISPYRESSVEEWERTSALINRGIYTPPRTATINYNRTYNISVYDVTKQEVRQFEVAEGFDDPETVSKEVARKLLETLSAIK